MTKRKFDSLGIIGLVLQGLVAVSPLIPGVKAVWGAQPSGIEVLSVNFAILSITLPFFLWVQLRPTADMLENLKGKQVELSWLKPPEFYTDFATAMEKATDYVDIGYMAAYPPSETAGKDRETYYERLPALIKRKGLVTFRRLVRDAKKSKPWIAETLTTMKGERNFSLCLVTDDYRKEDSLILSVQIVDGRDVWLVALRSHESKGGPRDLAIGSTVLADAMRGYYDRVWARGTVLMQQGNVTEAGKRFLLDAATEANRVEGT